MTLSPGYGRSRTMPPALCGPTAIAEHIQTHSVYGSLKMLTMPPLDARKDLELLRGVTPGMADFSRHQKRSSTNPGITEHPGAQCLLVVISALPV